LLIVVDQITKYLTGNFLKESVPLIKNVFHLTLAHNTGIGFGLLQNNNFILIFISVLIIAALIYLFNSSKKEKESLLAISLIMAGAIGNLIDRIFLGHIIDFLDFRIFPIFNFADSLITIGIIYLIYASFKKKD